MCLYVGSRQLVQLLPFLNWKEEEERKYRLSTFILRKTPGTSIFFFLYLGMILQSSLGNTHCGWVVMGLAKPGGVTKKKSRMVPRRWLAVF
jgi:hypothetical protein